MAYPANFEKAFAFVIEWEGTEYEKDPDDPGGATKYGIDQRSHRGLDIYNLTLDKAKAIYYSEWSADFCDKVDRPLCEVAFNFCVNTGLYRTVKFAQAVLGLDIDGKVGDKTRRAVRTADPLVLSKGIIDQADHFYTLLGSRMPKFVRGWLNRDLALRKDIATP
jgi:lysozyme family protein